MQQDKENEIQLYVNRPTKLNGFQTPLHPLQILGWFFFTYKISIYFILIMQIYEGIELQVICVIYGLFATLSFIFGFLVTQSDPTDQLVYQEREAQKNNQFFESPSQRFCLICNTHVQEKTKHCGVCNRCVDQFDHHCKWLNNCIGKLNYRKFIYLLINLLLMVITSIVVSIKTIILYHQYNDYFNKQLQISKLSFNQNQYLGLFISTFAFDQLLLIFLIDIIIYHIWLKFHNLSTYDHILMKRQQKDKMVEAKKSTVIKELKQIHLNQPKTANQEDTQINFNQKTTKIIEVQKINEQTKELKSKIRLNKIVPNIQQKPGNQGRVEANKKKIKLDASISEVSEELTNTKSKETPLIKENNSIQDNQNIYNEENSQINQFKQEQAISTKIIADQEIDQRYKVNDRSLTNILNEKVDLTINNDKNEMHEKDNEASLQNKKNDNINELSNQQDISKNCFFLPEELHFEKQNFENFDNL